jgi:hypothetical protein
MRAMAAGTQTATVWLAAGSLPCRVRQAVDKIVTSLSHWSFACTALA